MRKNQQKCIEKMKKMQNLKKIKHIKKRGEYESCNFGRRNGQSFWRA